jgi:hypothetical protein
MSSPEESGTGNQKYYPPSHEVLVHFAQNLGNELGGEFAEWEIVQGLADSMSVIARVLANDLNRKHNAEFDNRIE